MRKVLVIILVFLSVLVLILRYGMKPLSQVLGVTSRAGLRVEANKSAAVSIDGKQVGEAPYQDEDLTAGEYLISLKSQGEGSESGELSWQGYVKLNPGTLSIVNRDLSAKKSDQSGEVITLEKGKGITIVSTPPQAEVIIDGQSRGVTPLSVSDLGSGEHQFIISKDNFIQKSIRATLLEGFNLVLTVDLAIAEADLTKLPVVPVSFSREVVVKKTPTGFLRIRASASTNAKEVAQVKPGDVLTLLEEQPNWDRVRTSDNKEGWVASSYVEKKSQ